MAMWRRGAKLECATSYFLRECGKWLCFSCRSFSNSTRPVVHLHNSVTNAELSLVGIAHSCPKSADFVKHMIRDLMPKVVAVEICKERADSLLSCDRHESITWKGFLSLKGGLKEKSLRYIINELCVEPGYTQTMEEMKVAIQEGLAHGANVVYMDQDEDVVLDNKRQEQTCGQLRERREKLLQISRERKCKFLHRKSCNFLERVTFKRVAQEFSLMQVVWVILRRKGIYREYPILFRALDIGGDAITHPEALEELVRFADKYLPGLARSLVHERNAYMVKNLREMSGSIVGVVGAAHVQGIHKLWQEAETSALHVQEMHKLWQEAEA